MLTDLGKIITNVIELYITMLSLFTLLSYSGGIKYKYKLYSIV